MWSSIVLVAGEDNAARSDAACVYIRSADGPALAVAALPLVRTSAARPDQ